MRKNIQFKNKVKEGQIESIRVNLSDMWLELWKQDKPIKRKLKKIQRQFLNQ
jgi:hypothetical protein